MLRLQAILGVFPGPVESVETRVTMIASKRIQKDKTQHGIPSNPVGSPNKIITLACWTTWHWHNGSSDPPGTQFARGSSHLEHTRRIAKKRRNNRQFTVNHHQEQNGAEIHALCRLPHRLKRKGRVRWISSGDFPMAFQSASDFPHRRNKDGSFDSICLNCFATVASHMTEEELKEFDKKHVCANSLLSQRGNHVSSTQDETKTRDRH
jgi:hypothetical protein